jgi:hypothetical protein
MCAGVGYDLDEALLEDARRVAAADPSSAGQLQFLAQDLFTVDLSTPHVIFLYLLPEVLQVCHRLFIICLMPSCPETC